MNYLYWNGYKNPNSKPQDFEIYLADSNNNLDYQSSFEDQII